MFDPVFIELVKPLGIAIPLVVMLWFLLRQATDERRAITSDFLLTLRETIKVGTEQSIQVQAQLRAMTNEISNLSAESQERRIAATAEHKEIMEYLHRLSLLLDVKLPPRDRERAASV